MLEFMNFAGRDLSDRQMRDVRSAIRCVLFAAAVFAGTESRADGGYCDQGGCVVWASVPGGYGGSAGGAGGSSTGNPGCTEDCNPSAAQPVDAYQPHALSPAQLPNMAKLNCASSKYGLAPIHAPNFVNAWYFAPHNYVPNSMNFYWSDSSPYAPSGYDPLDGTTWIGSNGASVTWLFARGALPLNDSFPYIDPTTGALLQVNVSFTAFEHALMTVVHESAHQHGISSEARADGYGYSAVKAYRDDHGAKCP